MKHVPTGAGTSWEDDPFVTYWPEMRAFWAAAAEGRFLMPHCQACGKYHWHPRAICPFCESDRIAFVDSPGRGEVYSYSVARTWDPPHVVAFVQVDEGPCILTRIVDCDVESVRVGQKVKVRFIKAEEGRDMPAFAPAD